MKTTYKIVIKEYKQNEPTEVISEKKGFKSELAAKRQIKKLENVYRDGRFTFYGFDIVPE